ncbi:hypothetical protein BH23PAT1_BH23PAT1_0600 [soil metagenome]
MSSTLTEPSSIQEDQLESPRPRRWVTRENLVLIYGLLAVLGVAWVELFFSVHKGGYFPQHWFWGVSITLTLLGVSVLVPGYYSSLHRRQWILTGVLGSFVAIIALSILWSVAPELSQREAFRTAMYAGVFVLLLPAAVRWGWLIVDTTIFAALMPPALYGLLQKIYPTLALYTGFDSLEADPRASSTLGYHPTFGMMCAMGTLLAISRVGSLRPTLGYIPLRALYSATSVLFLAALYSSFSRGAMLALAGGIPVLLLLSKRRFEVLGNLAISGLALAWLVGQIQELPGLIIRPVTRSEMQVDGWLLVDPLLKAMLAVFVAQVLFSLAIRLIEGFVPRRVRQGARVVGTVAVAILITLGLAQAWMVFQNMGGVAELRSQLTSGDIYDNPEIERDTSQRYTSLDAAARLELWEIARQNWLQNPLAGSGGDTYQVVYAQQNSDGGGGDVLHPHSLWMRLLSDNGLIAFFAFAAFSVGLLAVAAFNVFATTRSRSGRALVAGSAAAAAAYLISSSIDWNWFIPASTLPFFALAAVATGMSRRKARTNGRKR